MTSARAIGASPGGGARLSHAGMLMLLTVLMMLLFLTASIINEADSGCFSAGVLLSFLLNGCIGVTFLAKSIVDSPFSLVQMHWLFYVSMFVVAPLSQYLCNYSVWGYGLSSEAYLCTNVLLAAWGALFALASLWRASDDRVSPGARGFFDTLPGVGRRASAVAFAVALASTVVVVSLVGVEGLFTRDAFDLGLDKTASLLVDKAVRPLPVFALALMIVRSWQERRVPPLLVMTLCLALVADFPAAMARYNMACLYGGLVLLAIGPLFERRGLFPVFFLVAFLVVFPAANAYRWEDFGVAMFAEAMGEAVANLPRGFCAVDYDAYSMVARTLEYVASYGIEWGYQLLGALLFFVPRSLWPAKPEGSGNLVCAAQGQVQLNISSPLPAEGLLNFGIAGLLAFALFAGLLCAGGGSWFSRSRSVLRVFYPFACFLLFFVMRGDLLSSLAFTVGYAASFFMLCLACFGPGVVFSRRCGISASTAVLRRRGRA